MMSLPPMPRVLRLFSNHLAMDRAARPLPGLCVTMDSLATFDSCTRSVGVPEGWRYGAPLWGRLMVRQLLHQVPLGHQPTASDPYAVRAVHRALLELRNAGVTEAAFAGNPLSEGLTALVRLLGQYERALARASVFDDSDRERHAVLAVARGELPPALSELAEVHVEGGETLLHGRVDLLGAFAARGADVFVRLAYDPQRPGAFAWPEASLHSLETRGHQRLHVHTDTRIGQGPLAAIRGAQFTGNTVVEHGPVRVMQVPNTAEQPRQVAATVLAWVRRGVPLHDICVVCADVDGLGPQVADELEAVGLASYTRRGSILSRTLPARVLLWALRLPEQDFPREPLCELWLACGRTIEVPDDHPWSPARVVDALRQSGYRSAKVGDLRRHLRAFGERLAARGNASAAAYEAVADRLEGFCRRIAQLPEQATLRAHASAIEQLFSDLQVILPTTDGHPTDPDGHQNGGRRLWRSQARVFEAQQMVKELLRELAAAPEYCAAPDGAEASDSTAASWSRAEMVDTLALLLDERRLSAGGLRAGAVAILSPADVVETHFACMVVAGVDVGVLPRAPVPDPVLTDPLRAEINRLLGPRLLQYGPMVGRGAIRGDARDTWLWLEVLAACQSELVVTFTSPEGEDDQGRSELIDELLRSAPNLEVESPPPSYALDTATSLPQLVQRWSLAAVAEGASIAPKGAPERGAALEIALQEIGVPTGHLRARVQAERHRRLGDWAHLPTLSERHRALIAERILGRVHSTSKLDALAMCAYRHFAQVLLGLSPQHLPTLAADARELGTAAHAALFHVYRDLKARGGLAAARRGPEEALSRARHVFLAHADDIMSEVVVHPLLRGATLEQAWDAVEAQVRADLVSESGTEPVAFEHRFDDRIEPGEGSVSKSPLRILAPDGERSICVRGSIDRIDIGARELLTLDYKRSKQNRSPGRHFQLPIYAAVALRDFGAAAGVRTHGAGWVTLSDGKRHMAIDVDDDPEAFVATLRAQVWQRLDQCFSGTVMTDPDPAKLCQRCDYAPLCRFEATDESVSNDDTSNGGTAA